MKEIFGIKKFKTKTGEERSFWTRIGVAHECQDGSLNCFLDYVPATNGITLNIREPKEKKGAEESEGF